MTIFQSKLENFAKMFPQYSESTPAILAIYSALTEEQKTETILEYLKQNKDLLSQDLDLFDQNTIEKIVLARLQGTQEVQILKETAPTIKTSVSKKVKSRAKSQYRIGKNERKILSMFDSKHSIGREDVLRKRIPGLWRSVYSLVDKNIIEHDTLNNRFVLVTKKKKK